MLLGYSGVLVDFPGLAQTNGILPVYSLVCKG